VRLPQGHPSVKKFSRRAITAFRLQCDKHEMYLRAQQSPPRRPRPFSGTSSGPPQPAPAARGCAAETVLPERAGRRGATTRSGGWQMARCSPAPRTPRMPPPLRPSRWQAIVPSPLLTDPQTCSVLIINRNSQCPIQYFQNNYFSQKVLIYNKWFQIPAKRHYFV